MFWELELHLASELSIPSEARRFLEYQWVFFSLVTPALSGSEEAVILVW